jgi:hypothetical protein
MNPLRLFTGPILLIGISVSLTTASRGSNSILPYAPPAVSPYTVNVSSSDCLATLSETDLFGVQPNDTIQISVSTCGIDCAGDVITIQPLDGGTVIGGYQSVVDAQTGAAGFTFQAGADSGVLQLTFLDDGCYFMTAQFWVLDLVDPGNNPPTIN